MYKTASPYVKELLKGEIPWQPFTAETFENAIRQDKMIFLHIGNIANIQARMQAYALFSDQRTIDILKENFICIAIDTEDVPEAYLIGMDLLIINEQKISEHINIFSLPGVKPVTSFSSLLPDDFLHIARNILTSFAHKREKLELAGKYLTQRLKLSGIITKKEEEKTISPKLLHAYIRSWSSRFLNKENKYRRKPYTLAARNLLFILEYAHQYNMQEYMEFIDETLQHVYYSPMFDPIEGGLFREAEDYTLKAPSYEKVLYENANAITLFTTAYKYLKKRIYKEAAERIAEFLESSMMIPGKGYFTYVTLNGNPSDSDYYKYSLKELKDVFPSRWKAVGSALGMDIKKDPAAMQTISNTSRYWDISYDELVILKRIRKQRAGSLLLDKRVMTGYNCKVASAFCAMSTACPKTGQKYLHMASQIIDNILKIQKKGTVALYKYISCTHAEYSISDLYDYSLFLNCVLMQYILTKEKKYLSLAKTYSEYIFVNYYIPETGMFSKTSHEKLRIPLKRAPVIDYNTLSSNSIMAENMLLLNKVDEKDSTYISTFKQQIYNIEPQLIGSGPFMTGWGMQLLNYLTRYTTSAPDEQ